jgi:periplasmic protein TonB
MPGMRHWGVESERDMYYATKRSNTKTRIAGVVGVVLGLGVSGYALANGLGIIETNERIETEVVMIEELDEVVEEEPPPPPVDVDLPPPPPQVILPDFVFDTPPPQENAVRQVQAVSNPAPPPPPAPAARPAPPAVPPVRPKADPNRFSKLLVDDYPAAAMRKKQEGDVTLSMCMGVDGRASDVKVIKSSGVDSLDEAAVKGIPKLRFQPAKDSTGKPVAWCPPTYPPYTMVLSWKLPE